MLDIFASIKVERLEPWPFQAEAIEAGITYVNDGLYLRKTSKKHANKFKAGLFVEPTGTGKSLIIGNLLARINVPAIVLQPKVELLEQNYEKFYSYGGLASVYSDKLKTKLASSTTFATLGSVWDKGAMFRDYYNVQVVFVDECHFGYPPEHDSQFMKFIRDLNPAVIIGFTASPLRLVSSRGTAELKMINRLRPGIWDDIIHLTQIPDIKDQYWTPINYVENPYDDSLLELNKSKTEYTEESIQASAKKNQINNKIYRMVNELLEKGYTSILVFTDTVDTANTLAYGTNAKGEPWIKNAEAVHAKTPAKKRRDIVKSFRSGTTNVLFNQGTFTTGFDYKALQVVILGRPTNSFGLYYQKIGRLVRKSPGKEFGMLIDFVNNVRRHGRLENINFENIPGHGWNMFSGETLLTNVDINSNHKPTKTSMINGAMAKAENKSRYVVFHTGPYVGMRVEDTNVPTSHIDWVANIMEPKYKEMQRMKDACILELTRRGIHQISNQILNNKAV